MHGQNQSAAHTGRYLNLYAKLGVSPNASTDAIRLAYQVLAEAYCPDGAYMDDAMHHGLLEIQNAAEILGNPKTRRLYDRGYIDGAGRPTEAGLAHARRLRTFGLSGGLLAVAGAAVLIIGFWPSSRPGNSGVQTTALQERATPVPAKEATPPPPAAANPAPPPKAAAEPPPAVSPVQQPQPAQPAQKQPSQTASQPGDAPGYLPPASSRQSLGQTPGFSSPGESKHRRYTQRLESQKRPEFAERDPSNPWEQDIWFPYRSTRHYEDNAPPPPSASRSASCLACLAGGGDCPGICP